MKNVLRIDSTIKPFNKKISVEGDKSLSIRWILMASQALGISIAYNLLESEDVLSALDTIKKLGILMNIPKLEPGSIKILPMIATKPSNIPAIVAISINLILPSRKTCGF